MSNASNLNFRYVFERNTKQNENSLCRDNNFFLIRNCPFGIVTIKWAFTLQWTLFQNIPTLTQSAFSLVWMTPMRFEKFNPFGCVHRNQIGRMETFTMCLVFADDLFPLSVAICNLQSVRKSGGKHKSRIGFKNKWLLYERKWVWVCVCVLFVT